MSLVTCERQNPPQNHSCICASNCGPNDHFILMPSFLHQKGYGQVPVQRGIISTQDNLQKEEHHLPLVVLPYTGGVSEDIWCVHRTYGISVIFKPGLSLGSVLTKVKDSANGETVHGRLPHSVQLCQDLHWLDQEKAGD